MSASEKLKMLNYRLDARVKYDLESALPQIVAVVEAAEEAKSAFDYIAQTQRLHPKQNLERHAQVNSERVLAALAALEEALS